MTHSWLTPDADGVEICATCNRARLRSLPWRRPHWAFFALIWNCACRPCATQVSRKDSEVK